MQYKYYFWLSTKSFDILVGGSCSTSCGNCTTIFNACTSGNSNNSTILCECYSDYVDCLTPLSNTDCDTAFGVYHQCVNQYPGCACGTLAPTQTFKTCTNGYCNSDVCTAQKSNGQSCQSGSQDVVLVLTTNRCRMWIWQLSKQPLRSLYSFYSVCPFLIAKLIFQSWRRL